MLQLRVSKEKYLNVKCLNFKYLMKKTCICILADFVVEIGLRFEV